MPASKTKARVERNGCGPHTAAGSNAFMICAFAHTFPDVRYEIQHSIGLLHGVVQGLLRCSLLHEKVESRGAVLVPQVQHLVQEFLVPVGVLVVGRGQQKLRLAKNAEPQSGR